MKKLILLLIILTSLSASAENYILYTSADGKKVKPTKAGVKIFGANIVANTYENGQGKILFDGKVTSIGYDAFKGCSKLESIELPNSVVKINSCAFENCSNLKSVVIPGSITEIANSAFWNCSSLKSIDLPNSVKKIGNSAFGQCSSLTLVVLPNSVNTIGDSAFTGCKNLKSLVLPNSVTKIGDNAFTGCPKLFVKSRRSATVQSRRQQAYSHNPDRLLHRCRNGEHQRRQTKYPIQNSGLIPHQPFRTFKYNFFRKTLHHFILHRQLPENQRVEG